MSEVAVSQQPQDPSSRTGTCRTCRTRVPLNERREAMTHKDDVGRPCPGAGVPPSDEGDGLRRRSDGTVVRPAAELLAGGTVTYLVSWLVLVLAITSVDGASFFFPLFFVLQIVGIALLGTGVHRLAARLDPPEA